MVVIDADYRQFSGLCDISAGTSNCVITVIIDRPGGDLLQEITLMCDHLVAPRLKRLLIMSMTRFDPKPVHCVP